MRISDWSSDVCSSDLVLATGCASTALARAIGIDLPIYPVKGYSVTVATEGRVRMPVRPFIDWDRKICITPLGDRLRAAGTAEFAGDDATLWPARRSEERRVGNVCVSTGMYRWVPD